MPTGTAAVLVFVCPHGGQVLKRDLPSDLPFALVDYTCSKCGDACVRAARAGWGAYIQDEPLVPTVCVCCHKAIHADSEWSNSRCGAWVIDAAFAHRVCNEDARCRQAHAVTSGGGTVCGWGGGVQILNYDGGVAGVTCPICLAAHKGLDTKKC